VQHFAQIVGPISFATPVAGWSRRNV
jgi:hypothetical protein